MHSETHAVPAPSRLPGWGRGRVHTWNALGGGPASGSRRSWRGSREGGGGGEGAGGGGGGVGGGAGPAGRPGRKGAHASCGSLGPALPVLPFPLSPHAFRPGLNPFRARGHGEAPRWLEASSSGRRNLQLPVWASATHLCPSPPDAGAPMGTADAHWALTPKCPSPGSAGSAPCPTPLPHPGRAPPSTQLPKLQAGFLHRSSLSLCSYIQPAPNPADHTSHHSTTHTSSFTPA